MIRLLSLSIFLSLISGCGPRELASPPQSPSAEVPGAEIPAVVALATHLSVPRPPQLSRSEPVLWVGLEDHLGSHSAAMPLRLSSAGAPLTLEDGSGRSWKAASFTVRWESVALLNPLTLARRIAGPFASFESAERLAQRWRAMGVTASVAHPNEWEVWAPQGSIAPEGTSIRDWTHRVHATIEPTLETPEGLQSIKGPLQITAPDGLRWNRGVFLGPFRLQRDAYGSWTLIEQVAVERYLEGVVPHEIGASSPVSALEAQTVLARTWALANSHRFNIDGYHLCSDTQCQVYSDPRLAGAAVRQAIAATRGRLLSRAGRPISAVYHATNGGVMAAGPEAWAMQPQPYLVAKVDGDEGWRRRHAIPMQQPQKVSSLLIDYSGAYGAQHPLFRWSRVITADEIRHSIGAPAQVLQSPLQLNALQRGTSGRVLALQIASADEAEPVVLRLDRIRRTLRRLPSTLFVIEPQGLDRWLIRGGGFGHGAGLSQAGAIDLAWRGWSTERILSHYYPGTVYGPLPAGV